MCPSVRRGLDFEFQDLHGQIDMTFFFFRPFRGSNCDRRCCHHHYSSFHRHRPFFFFFFSPFSGGLPRVNTKVFLFFFSPFSSGLPRVNTKVFFFFFSRPFPAGCLRSFFFLTLFRRAAQG